MERRISVFISNNTCGEVDVEADGRRMQRGERLYILQRYVSEDARGYSGSSPVQGKRSLLCWNAFEHSEQVSPHHVDGGYVQSLVGRVDASQRGSEADHVELGVSF